MIDPKDLDVIAETKREVTDAFKEKVLIGAAKAFLTAICEAVDAPNAPFAMLTAPIMARSSKATMAQIFDEVGIARGELEPSRLLAVAHRVGILSTALHDKLTGSLPIEKTGG